MKILQKIEFWFFSVPALLVAIGGIAHYGAWRALWVFPVCGWVLNADGRAIRKFGENPCGYDAALWNFRFFCAATPQRVFAKVMPCAFYKEGGR